MSGNASRSDRRDFERKPHSGPSHTQTTSAADGSPNTQDEHDKTTHRESTASPPRRLTLREKFFRRTEWLLKVKTNLMTSYVAKQDEMNQDPMADEASKMEHSGFLLKLEGEIIDLERDKIKHLRDVATEELDLVLNEGRKSRSPRRETFTRYRGRGGIRGRYITPFERRGFIRGSGRGRLIGSSTIAIDEVHRRRRRSPSVIRSRHSRSPRSKRSRSPQQRLSRSPRAKVSRSLRARASRSPQAIYSRSLRARYSRSPKYSRSPRSRYSKSPRSRYSSRSPRSMYSRSPHSRYSRSPRARYSRSTSRAKHSRSRDRMTTDSRERPTNFQIGPQQFNDNFELSGPPNLRLDNDWLKSQAVQVMQQPGQQQSHGTVPLQPPPVQPFNCAPSPTMVPNPHATTDDNDQWQAPVIAEHRRFSDEPVQSDEYWQTAASSGHDEDGDGDDNDNQQQNAAAEKRFEFEQPQYRSENRTTSMPWLYSQTVDKPSVDSHNRISLKNPSDLINKIAMETVASAAAALSNAATMVITEQTGIPQRILDKNRLWFDEECLHVARAQHIAKKLSEQKPTEANVRDYETKKKTMNDLFRKKFCAFDRRKMMEVRQLATAAADASRLVAMEQPRPLPSPQKIVSRSALPEPMADEPWYDEECESASQLKRDAWELYDASVTKANKRNYERSRQLVDKLFEKKAKKHQEKQATAAEIAKKKRKASEEDTANLWYDNECRNAEDAMNVALDIYKNSQTEDNMEVYLIRKRQMDKLFQQKLQKMEELTLARKQSELAYKQQQKLANEYDALRLATPPPPKLSRSDFDEMQNSSSSWQLSTVTNDERPTRNIRSHRNDQQQNAVVSYGFESFQTDGIDSSDYAQNDLYSQQLFGGDRQRMQPTSARSTLKPVALKWQSSFQEVAADGLGIVSPSGEASAAKRAVDVWSAGGNSKSIEQRRPKQTVDPQTLSWQKFMRKLEGTSHGKASAIGVDKRPKPNEDEFNGGRPSTIGGNYQILAKIGHLSQAAIAQRYRNES